MIDFTQLTEKLPYPPRFKAAISTYHADIISYAVSHFKDKADFKSNVIRAMNSISCIIVRGDTAPILQSDNPLKEIHTIDDEICIDTLGNLYIDYRKVKWDIEETTESVELPKPVRATFSDCANTEPTPKEDLYLKSPIVPLFDIEKPWLNVEKDGEIYTIYTSLPIIPETQREISVTTNINLMTKSDLMRLYPNQFIRTRASCMYEPIANLDYDEDIGIIPQIDGFHFEQIRNNIIKYPHFYKLKRKIDDKFVSFYSHIEINGVLYNTLDVWDTLPESKILPKTTEFIKEYVVRRYLLERDEKNIKHKYPLFGSLDPFLTLFTTPVGYKKLGIYDAEDTARQCVSARVQYLQTRNPILRKVYNLP